MTEYTFEEAKRVWLISDTHFDHANIIRYCGRPFGSVQEMNDTLRYNWNDTIDFNHIAYFLGDMRFGWHSRKAWYWLSRLNGRKVFVRGSHDQRREIRGDSVLKVVDRETVQVGDVAFLLVHDPFGPMVNGWEDWVIHGHLHNNLPFFDPKNRRVNVSVEVTGYRPVCLAEILRLVKGVRDSNGIKGYSCPNTKTV